VLGQHLAPTDLQSLLLEVFRRRAAHRTPRRVLEQYEQDPFVRPAQASVDALLELDRLALAHAVPPFEAIELSPLAPLGTCSALAPVDQNRVVSTVRNTEVVSDSTNILALECALRRRAQRREGREVARAQRLPGGEPWVRLCASQRLVRAQRYTQPQQRAHFRLFSLCTAGRAGRTPGFELVALAEQVAFYLRFLAALEHNGYRLAGLRVAFIPLAGEQERNRLEQQVIAPLASQVPAARLEIDPNPSTAPGYYEWVRFGIYARDAHGEEHMLADGGFTNWTQQLLSDRRERLLISGVSTERISTLFRDDQSG
jgi:hypothetical protein